MLWCAQEVMEVDPKLQSIVLVGNGEKLDLQAQLQQSSQEFKTTVIKTLRTVFLNLQRVVEN